MDDDVLLLVHTAVAITGVVLLITKARLHPVFALAAGTTYLGVAAGLGLATTLTTLTGGFGEILGEIGLLIAFGITMGTALAELGAIDRIVRGLLRLAGPRRAPLALGLTTGTALQAIFADVMLVVTAPVARGVARASGPGGLPLAAGALVTGILTGLVFMVPSVGSLALAGVIGVPLWRYLLLGTLVGAVAIAVTVLVLTLLVRRTRFWDAAVDEDAEALARLDAESSPADEESDGAVRPPLPLAVAVAPLVLSLLLVAAGSVGDLVGLQVALVSFVADPTVALGLGALTSVLLVRRQRGEAGVRRALSSSFGNLGEVLVLTGLGGSLAGMVAATGLGDVLADFFASSAGPPVLLAWLIAAVLHVAIGSVSVAAITSAGILAPVAASAGVDPVLVALAAGAGSLFLMTVHSNFFWMARNLTGQTTRGAVKLVGTATSVSSVAALGGVLLLTPVLAVTS